MSPVSGTVGPPVDVTITSADEVKLGQPMTIQIVIEALADIQNAQFELIPPQGQWRVQSNELKWVFSLKKGEARQIGVAATPTVEKPAGLSGRVDLQGFLPFQAIMDIGRAGGRRPEVGIEDPSAQKPVGKEPEPRPQWEEALPLPDPQPTPEPRTPGDDGKGAKADAASHKLEASKDGTSRNADAPITATGRFVFSDDLSRRSESVTRRSSSWTTPIRSRMRSVRAESPT